jgi:hypothetical protein
LKSFVKASSPASYSNAKCSALMLIASRRFDHLYLLCYAFLLGIAGIPNAAKSIAETPHQIGSLTAPSEIAVSLDQWEVRKPKEIYV